MRRLTSSLALVMATVLLMMPTEVLAVQSLSGACDVGQYIDNTWGVRDAYTGQSGPWLTSASASISRYDYSLCTGGARPKVSGTGAWVAIEGPGSNDIVQVGYWKCGDALICGNGMHTNQLDFFYSSGSDDWDHAPWPKNISLADAAGSHVFKVELFYNTDGSRTWRYMIDGQIRASEPDGTWRKWNRVKTQIGTEQYNCGDQLGGRVADGSDPGNKQKFRSLTWVAGGVTHSDGFGAPYIGGNNPLYPWLFVLPINSTDFDVWTANHAQTCSAA